MAAVNTKNGRRRDVVRIAMWSGPRNISTALLRAWGSRADTFVCDEPFYAHYLRETGVQHPGRDEVLAAQENDWTRVRDQLTGAVPGGKAIFYQKQMAHHLLPHMEGDWILSLRNALLIRDPADMLVSLHRVAPDPRLEETGLPQQWRLFESVRERAGTPPPVIDARDVLDDPERMLALLCRTLDVPFDRAMLSWERGPRPTDGVWGKHWYGKVWNSAGFGPYPERAAPLPAALASLHGECLRYYERLHAQRLRA